MKIHMDYFLIIEQNQCNYFYFYFYFIIYFIYNNFFKLKYYYLIDN
jgi:hypothetical protein